ncbi:hypothetical protein LCGC14_1255290 [marine sediment metagenome]|uniref:Uncharacterized protein n=1 Tax=marine sediment metagenome TaxID=412755 RepID=A0A0F9P5T7_9ZZZZ
MIEEKTHALVFLDWAHHVIHEGNAYCAHVSNPDMDKSEEINICFTTPDNTTYLHALVLPVSSIFAEFKICEGATVTASTGTDVLARNRNRNESDTSVIVSTYDGSSYKLTRNATVTDDGTIIHIAMFGSGKRGGGAGGMRGTSEFILKVNTTYAFRLIGNGISSDNGIASLKLTWYEHINMRFE